VAEIKRLNKIQRENEIFAFKVLKVPLTAHNILLDTLPKVHKSGNSSPQANGKFGVGCSSSSAVIPKEKLEEKLLLASVSNATIAKSSDAADRLEQQVNEEDESVNDPLLNRNRQFRGYPRSIRPPNDFLQFNGSDCELNWIVLLLAILALCVIVPLIYVLLVYENPEKFHHGHSKYDDPEIKYHFHVNSTPK
jgi:hypothetical protein